MADLELGQFIRLRGGTRISGIYGVSRPYRKRFDNYLFVIVPLHGREGAGPSHLIGGYGLKTHREELHGQIGNSPRFVFTWDADNRHSSNSSRISADVREIEVLHPSEHPEP